MNWTAGPHYTLTYTKPSVATDSAIIEGFLQFSILALAWWENNNAAYTQTFQVPIGFTRK